MLLNNYAALIGILIWAKKLSKYS